MNGLSADGEPRNWIADLINSSACENGEVNAELFLCRLVLLK